MTRHIADSENFDHAEILAMRICSARLDASVNFEDFVRMVGRLVDVIVAAAEERWQDEQRTPRVEITHERNRPIEIDWGAVVEPFKCRHCLVSFVEGREHMCAGFDIPSSTGAAASAPMRTNQADGPAASESAAAPSITPHTTPSDKSPGAAPSRLSESAAATSAEAPRAPRVDFTEPQRDAAAHSPTRGSRQRRMTADELDTLRDAYLHDRRTNGGTLPEKWIPSQVKALGFTYQSIWGRVKEWDKEPLPAQPLEPLDVSPATRHRVVTAEPKPGEQPREHLNGNGCWCRKGPNAGANRWCDNAPRSSAPIGLRSRVPPSLRNERFSGERVKSHETD